ncbi:MAG TPA: AMP-binding protein, partial [Thermoanaerobaculia bacterium]|nr:AMP-binding protein [Thermoanaerobaculia bacterium]
MRILRERANESPEVCAYTYLTGRETLTLTYAELDIRARTIAAHLQQRNAAGERALLLYPPSMDYIAGFYGCLAAGAIAVPAYPPRMNRSLGRLEAIIDDARPKFALTTEQVLRQIREHAAESPVLSRVDWIATDQPLPESADA